MRGENSAPADAGRRIGAERRINGLPGRSAGIAADEMINGRSGPSGIARSTARGIAQPPKARLFGILA